jgi:hypothetical protein
LGTLVSSTNKDDRHDTTEILLKVVLNTIIPIPYPILVFDLTPPELDPTIYHMRGKYTNHYTTDVVFFFNFNKDLNIQILAFKQYIFGNKIFCIFSII